MFCSFHAPKKNLQANPQLQTSCSLSVFFQGKAAEVNAHFDLNCPGNEKRDDFCSNLSLSRDYSNLLALWTSLLDHWLSQYWQALQLSENLVFLSGKSVQDRTATSLLQSEDFLSLLPSLPLPPTEQKFIGACPSSCSLLPFLWCSCYLLLEGILVLAFSILSCKSIGSCFHSHSLVIDLSCLVCQPCFLCLNEGSGLFISILVMNQASVLHWLLFPQLGLLFSSYCFLWKYLNFHFHCGTTNARVIQYNCLEINYHQMFCIQSP